MLGILIDGLVLAVTLFFVNRDETFEIGKMILVSVGLAAVNFGISLVLVKPLGILALVPMIAANTGLLMWWCSLSLPKALIVVAVLFAVKVAYILLFTAMLA